MKRAYKILGIFLIIICSICVFNTIDATTIDTSANSIEKGKSVTITVTVPNVNTVDLTATVSGAGTSGTIRIVDGDMMGNAKSFSKSITVTPSSAGTITISVTSGSNAVLNGQYVNVAASKTITVTEPKPVEPAPKPVTPPVTQEPTTNNKPTTNKPVTNTKSSNANLKNMILSVEGLSPAFAKNITNYSLTVGENVNEIKVNASVEHSRATYSVSGNTNLKDGENIIKVKVTAENGAVKTYTINILKANAPIKSDATLSSLIIEDVDLGQVFDPNVTEYNAGDITIKQDKLNIFAYTTADNATLEIIGNENLKAGEQKITIRVTSENGKVVKDYVVTFNKIADKEDDEIQTAPLKEVEEKTTGGLKTFYNNTIKPNSTVLILYMFIWIEFIQVVYLYEKLKKYENVDKITVGKIKKEKNKKEKQIKFKEERTRRQKVNPVFPDEQN